MYVRTDLSTVIHREKNQRKKKKEALLYYVIRSKNIVMLGPRFAHEIIFSKSQSEQYFCHIFKIYFKIVHFFGYSSLLRNAIACNILSSSFSASVVWNCSCVTRIYITEITVKDYRTAAVVSRGHRANDLLRRGLYVMTDSNVGSSVSTQRKLTADNLIILA